MSKPWYAFFKRAAAYVVVSASLASFEGGVGPSAWAARPAATASPVAPALPMTDLSFGARVDAGVKVGDTFAYSLGDPAWQVDPAEGGLKNGFLFRPGKLFTPLAAGTLSLPALRVLGASGTVVAQTNPIQITIASNLTEKDKQDPKGPQPEPPLGPRGLPFPQWIQSLIAFSVLGLVLTGIFFLFRYLRRKAAGALERILPKKPFDLATLDRLEALGKAGHIEKRTFKPYYFGISEAMKFYLGERFDFDAQESTTAELFGQLRTRTGEPGLNDGVISRIEELFNSLDPVKFADFVPTDSEARDVLREARELVLATRKVVAEPIVPSSLVQKSRAR